MSATKERLENIFKSVGCDGSAKKLTSNELDDFHTLLNDTTCGTNILYCETPKASPILSSVFLRMVFSSLVIVLTMAKKGLFHLQIHFWTQSKLPKNVTLIITWYEMWSVVTWKS